MVCRDRLILNSFAVSTVDDAYGGICISSPSVVTSASGLGSLARPASQSSGTGAAALPVRGGWLRGHARTCSSADQRTGERILCDTGHQVEKSARHGVPLGLWDLYISDFSDTMRHRHGSPAHPPILSDTMRDRHGLPANTKSKGIFHR